ncbi:MAG: DNA primase [Candidatus Korarchaeota archaeon]|nr:DNA primase [Candidatus Korarchaeota archaeon]
MNRMTRAFHPKYIIKAKMFCEGIVEKSDIIGAIFGQLDGILPESLNLQRLQETKKIDRMQVEISHQNGKTKAWLKIPTTLPKVKLAILAAALEQVNRVGPSKTETIVTNIADTLEKARDEVIERASEILGQWNQMVTPKRANLLSQVEESLYRPKIVNIGKENLPAGSRVKKSNEIIVVEGRADVLTMLKYGFDNTIAIQGASIPDTVKDLIKGKIATLFVDGDRSGFLITKEALTTTDVDYIARAPQGKEVQDLSLKEIRDALNRKIPVKSLKIEVENALTFKDIAPKEFFQTPEGEEKKKAAMKKLKNIRTLHDSKLRRKLFSTLRENLLGKEEFAIYEYPKKDTNITMIQKGQIAGMEKSIMELKGKTEKILLMDGTVNQKIINSCVPANFKIIVGTDIEDVVKQPYSLKIDVLQ